MDYELMPSNWTDDDHVLDQQLANLAHFTPRFGFADRVMERVRILTPQPAHALHAAAPVRARRVSWLAGGAVAASVVSVSIVAAVLLANLSGFTGAVGSLINETGVPAWRGALAAVPGLAYDAYGALGISTLSIGTVLGATAYGLSVLIANAWVLYQLMQPSEGMRVRFHGVR